MDYDFYFLDFPETKLLFSILSENGIEAMFVGGCVRDSILGLKNSDLDIAVNANIQHVKEVLSSHGIHCIPTGLKYGSITAIVNHRHFELTTLRKDEVCFGRDCITSNVSRCTSFLINDVSPMGLLILVSNLIFSVSDKLG